MKISDYLRRVAINNTFGWLAFIPLFVTGIGGAYLAKSSCAIFTLWIVFGSAFGWTLAMWAMVCIAQEVEDNPSKLNL